MSRVWLMVRQIIVWSAVAWASAAVMGALISLARRDRFSRNFGVGCAIA
ncbi:MAG: hypothetical protein M3Q23_13375 [Actinomycetota bacterium]|nr:hypothetical protein [Actinomycetota bacterium]